MKISPKVRSLLIIIAFTFMLIAPVTYALIKNFFGPKTEAKQAAPAATGH